MGASHTPPQPDTRPPNGATPFYGSTDPFRQAAAALTDAAQAIDSAARALRRLADDPGPPAETTDHLRGQRLIAVIGELVEQIAADGWPMHYRDLFALVERRGYRVGGRDPLATFLTALTRTPGIQKVGGHRGLYEPEREETP